MHMWKKFLAICSQGPAKQRQSELGLYPLTSFPFCSRMLRVKRTNQKHWDTPGDPQMTWASLLYNDTTFEGKLFLVSENVSKMLLYNLAVSPKGDNGSDVCELRSVVKWDELYLFSNKKERGVDKASIMTKLEDPMLSEINHFTYQA